ncbi:hypothetical protein [Streptomyces klenkii]|uniref:hypothetical protein n=1 Tax=Streptomyces klenkii TaxID=1420899 RepID=UPI003F689CCE
MHYSEGTNDPALWLPAFGAGMAVAEYRTGETTIRELLNRDSDENAGPGRSRMTDAQYVAGRSVLWSGVSALFTDGRGRVLLEDVDYRRACLLSGDADEAPSLAVAREVRGELGLTRRFPAPWPSAGCLRTPPCIFRKQAAILRMGQQVKGGPSSVGRVIAVWRRSPRRQG